MLITVAESASCGLTVTGYNPDVASLGRAIRLRREALDPRISQTELGRRVGFGQALVSQWERGETVPDAMQLAAIAMALNCGVEELVVEGLPNYKRWRGDLARHGGTEDGSSELHSQGDPTNAAAETRVLLTEVQASYRSFYDEVKALASQLTELADRQPEIIGAGGHHATPDRRRVRRSPRGTRRAG